MYARVVSLLLVASAAQPAVAGAPVAPRQDPMAFPIVEGDYQMTREWKITLPGPFRRRFEDGSLVLWRPGVTVWVNVWGDEKGTPPRERLKGIKSAASLARFDELEVPEKGGVLRWSYRLDEGAGDGRAPALYGVALSRTGYVQLAIYFDREADVALARALWRSVSRRLKRQA